MSDLTPSRKARALDLWINGKELTVVEAEYIRSIQYSPVVVEQKDPPDWFYDVVEDTMMTEVMAGVGQIEYKYIERFANRFWNEMFRFAIERKAYVSDAFNDDRRPSESRALIIEF